MPAGSTVWSAEVAGRPIRPGAAESDAVLLPLEKGRAGVEAPDLRRRSRVPAADRRVDAPRAGRGSNLPALDLPVSRTGLELYYSPRFQRRAPAGRVPRRQRSRCLRRGAARRRRRRSRPRACRHGRRASRQRAAGARRPFQKRARRAHGRRLAPGTRDVSGVRVVDLSGVRADRRRTRAGRGPHLQADEELTMTTMKASSDQLAPSSLACAHSAAAQQPPRPNESPRAVTLSLGRVQPSHRSGEPAAGAGRARRWPSVLASADLRVRVERDTARGVFNLTGDVLRAGVSRVSLMSGATLIEASVAGRPRSAGRGRAGARGAAAGAGPVFALARMGCAAQIRARTRVVRPPGATRPGPRARRSICRAIRPTCICPPAWSRAARPARAGRSSRPRWIRDRRPKSGGRCATARRQPRRAKCVRWPT